MKMKVVFNCEPSALTAVMIATEMPAAINPYLRWHRIHPEGNA
jgi:hypothetical protein